MLDDASVMAQKATEALFAAASSADRWNKIRDAWHYDLPGRFQGTDALRVLQFHDDLEGLAYAASSFNGLDSPSRRYLIRTFTRGLSDLLDRYPELADQIDQLTRSVTLSPDKSFSRLYPASFGRDAADHTDAAPRIDFALGTQPASGSDATQMSPTVLHSGPAPLANLRVKFHGKGAADSLTPRRLGLSPVRNWHPALLSRRIVPPVGLLPPTTYGRDPVITSLSELLTKPDGKCHALIGDPGVGKSTVALTLAQRARDAGHDVWWIQGPTEVIQECMFTVADQLGVDESDLAAARAGKRSLLDLVWHRLERSPRPWLLVFDGIDEARLMNSLVGDGKGYGWIRPSKKGLVIVSSCLTGSSAVRRYMTAHTIEHLSAPDLIHLLEDSGISSATAKRASLDIAIRYLHSTPFTVKLYAQYLATVADTEDSFDGSVRAHVDELSALIRTAEGQRDTDPVTEILQAIFKFLSTTGSLDALLLLGVIAHYASGVPIPVDFLDSEILAHSDIISSTWMSNDVALQSALQSLCSLGLIEIKDDSYEAQDSGRFIHAHSLITRRWINLLRDQSASQLERASIAASRILASATQRQSRAARDSGEWIYLATHLKSFLDNLKVQRDNESIIENSIRSSIDTITHLSQVGAYPAAVNIGRRAIALSRSVDEEDPVRLELETAFAKALILRGDTGRALRIMEKVCDVRQRLFGLDPECLDALDVIALLLGRQGQFGQAEQAFRQALTVRQRPDSDQAARMRTLSDLSRLLLQRGKLGEAERLSRQVWRSHEHGDSHAPEFFDSAINLSTILLRLGNFDEAEKILRDVHRAKEVGQGPEHPDTINAEASLALVLRVQGKLTEAEALLQQASRIARMMLGPEHPDTIDVQASLALVCRDLGRLSEADRLFRDVLEARRKRLGTDHPDYLSALLGVGVILNDTGHLEQAEEIFRSLIRKFEPSAGPEDPTLLSAHHNLGAVLQNKGMIEESEKHYRIALAAREWSLGSNHVDTLSTLANLGSLLRIRGVLDEADQVLHQAAAAYTELLGEQHPTTLTVTANVGSVYLDSGRASEAVKIYRNVLGWQQKILGERHPNTLLTRVNLAVALSEQGNFPEAETHLKLTIETYSTIFQDSHPNLLTARYQLARVFEKQGRLRSALTEYREVADSLHAASDKNLADVTATRLGVSRVLLALDEPDQSHANYLQAIQQAIRANARPAI